MSSRMLPTQALRRRHTGPAVAVFATVVVAAAAILVACASGSPNPARNASPASPASHAPGASSAAATAPTSTSRSASRSADGVWISSARTKIDTVESSITWAQWVVRRPDHRGLAKACDAILVNVHAVNRLPASPDRTVRHALSQEMSDFTTAANQCLAGELESAGRSVQSGHHWAEISGRRIVTLLHEE